MVRSAHYAYGKTFVNITVEQRMKMIQCLLIHTYNSFLNNMYLYFKAKRVNKPPRADISPKEQTITLPTNEVVLDGSSEFQDLEILTGKLHCLRHYEIVREF